MTRQQFNIDLHNMRCRNGEYFMSRFDDMINGLREDVEIPETVWRGYAQTLADLPGRGDRKMSSKKYRKNRGKTGMSYLKAAVLILVSVTLLGTGAYAAEKYFGILDFLGGSGNTGAVPPVEAEELIVPVTKEQQEKTEITEGMLADYTVKEAMCDSDSIYVVLEARAKEAGRYFFIPEDAIAEDLVSDWGMDGDISAGEYAASKNLEIMHVNAGIQNTDELGIAVSTIYFQSVDDDVMDIMIECGKTAEEQTLEVVCTGILWDDSMESMDDIMRTEIRFELTDISDSASTAYVPAGNAEIPGTAAVIESAEVTQTKLGTYLEILFRDDSEDFYMGPCFRLAGESLGEEHRIRMPSGTEALENGEYFWKLSLEKMEFGDSILLEAYDAETKEVYGTFELVRQ